jgi:soluble lytic murein transglycosylase-like protein
MQLMPATAQSLGVDPTDPVQNVDAGARYLRELLQKYDGLLWHALAAYNAGSAAVDKYNGVPPYNETILYVKKIDQQYRKSDN